MTGTRRYLTLVLTGLMVIAATPAQTFLQLETTLFDNQNINTVFNNPTEPTVFSIAHPHQITFIETYHWNSTQGQPPGRISLRHSDGTLYGPWVASSRDGYLGVPNAYWSVAPYEVIKAGTYTVVNSDPASWSHNPASGNQGFATVKGFRWYGDVPDGKGLGSINARVVAFQFYEQSVDNIPFEERAYSRTFEQQSTRYVAYELRLEYSALEQVTEFPLTVRYYRPDGSEMGTLDHTIKIQPDWTRSWYSWSLGWQNPGNWPTGRYTVKVFEGAGAVATGGFQILTDREAADTIFNWLQDVVPELSRPATQEDNGAFYRYFPEISYGVRTEAGRLALIDPDDQLIDCGEVNFWLSYIDNLNVPDNFDTGPLHSLPIDINPAALNRTVTDPHSGLVFHFPAGAAGVLKTGHILSGPPGPFQGEAEEGRGFFIDFEGTGTVELILPGAEDGTLDLPVVYVFAGKDGAYHDAIGNQPRWHGVPYRVLSGGRMAFTLFLETESSQRQGTRLVQSDSNKPSSRANGAEHYWINHLRPNSDHWDIRAYARNQASDDYHPHFLNALNASRRSAAETHMKAYPLHVQTVPKGAYYTGFGIKIPGTTPSPRPIVSIMTDLPEDARLAFGHELGHYYTHLLVGDTRYLELESWQYSKDHAPGIHVGRHLINEEYAYFIQYFLQGPGMFDRAQFFRLDYPPQWARLVRQNSPNRDYPGIEGFGAHMLGTLTYPKDRIVNIYESEQDVPVMGLSHGEVFEIIAGGAMSIDALRERIHNALGTSNRTAFQVHLQALGWNYSVTGRFVDQRGAPVATKSGVFIRNMVKVGDTEYWGGFGNESTSEGRFNLSFVFGGSSTLVLTLQDGSEVTVQVPPIDWKELTTKTINVGDLVVDTGVCPTRTVGWGDGCSGTALEGPADATRSIDNTASGYMGNAVFLCNNGNWTAQSATCTRTGADCPTQSVSWGNGCSGTANYGSSGTTRTVESTASGRYGSAKFSCLWGNQGYYWGYYGGTCRDYF